jgi:NADPH:quinone reductase-like Zn-dependent oxidoreductase
MIYGASGSVGTYAVQLAKSYGPEVTGVCSTDNLDMVASIRADHVIDYKKKDLSSLDVKYDLVFDAVGKISKPLAKGLLMPGGKFLSVHGNAKLDVNDLGMLKEMIEADKIKPVIDRQYNMEDVVEAHRYVEQFHKKGNVVLKVTRDA